MVENLIHFLLAIMALLIIPGPDMALCLANGIAYGKRGALYTAVGISCGGILLSLLTALFVAIAFSVGGQLLKWIQFVGVLYILYLAFITIKDTADAHDDTVQPTEGNLFFSGMITNLSNPKAFIFFLAFIPQFVPENANHPWVFAFALGVLLCLVGGVVNFSIGVAGTFLSFFNRMSFYHRTWGQWIVCITFVSIAVAFMVDMVFILEK